MIRKNSPIFVWVHMYPCKCAYRFLDVGKTTVFNVRQQFEIRKRNMMIDDKEFSKEVKRIVVIDKWLHSLRNL